MDDNIHKERRISVDLRPMKSTGRGLSSQISEFDSSILGLTYGEMFVIFALNGDVSLNIGH